MELELGPGRVGQPCTHAAQGWHDLTFICWALIMSLALPLMGDTRSLP